MKVQVPGKVKMVATPNATEFQSRVQELVDDGFVPFGSGMTESKTRWSILMMKPKMVEVDPETGERLDGKN